MSKKFKDIIYGILVGVAFIGLLVFGIYSMWQNHIEMETIACENKLRDEIGKELSGVTFDKIEFHGDIFKSEGHYYFSGDVHYFSCSALGEPHIILGNEKFIK